MIARRSRVLAFVVLLPALFAAPANAAREGAVSELRMASAALHDPSRSVRVYLPPSYARPDDGARHYPVLYLLHGWPGGDGNWPGQGRAAETLDSLSARGEIPEMIAIMPNGKGVGTLGRSLWLDAASGRSNLEEFLVHDLVDWVDATFRTRPEPGQRMVVGLSDGGTAAFNLVMRHPDRFGAAGSLSGTFRLKREWGMNDALVGHGNDAQHFLAANSPTVQAPGAVDALRRARLYLDCGSEDLDLPNTREFHELLLSLGVPHHYDEFPGDHGWGFWRAHLRDALLVLAGPLLGGPGDGLPRESPKKP